MSPLVRLAPAAAALCLAVAGPVLAQDPDKELPDGPGKEIVVRACTGCHGADQITYKRRTPEDWDYVITKMMQGGAELTADEQEAVHAYLVKALGAPPPPPPPPAPATPPAGTPPPPQPG
jgi:mono/diheme cytochrome c family protein